MKHSILLFALIFSQIAFAKKTHPAEAARAKNLAAVTVYLDISAFGRKERAARRMTEMHQEFAHQNYVLVGVSPYTENGDLQGFFISYKTDKKK